MVCYVYRELKDARRCERVELQRHLTRLKETHYPGDPERSGPSAPVAPPSFGSQTARSHCSTNRSIAAYDAGSHTARSIEPPGNRGVPDSKVQKKAVEMHYKSAERVLQKVINS